MLGISAVRCVTQCANRYRYGTRSVVSVKKGVQHNECVVAARVLNEEVQREGYVVLQVSTARAVLLQSTVRAIIRNAAAMSQ